MSSDDAYASFLDKANEDPSAGRAKVNGTHPDGTTNGVHAREVPQRLVTAAKDQFYVSDADEPWVPVSFDLGDASSLPNEGEYFARVCTNSNQCTDRM